MKSRLFFVDYSCIDHGLPREMRRPIEAASRREAIAKFYAVTAPGVQGVKILAVTDYTNAPRAR